MVTERRKHPKLSVKSGTRQYSGTNFPPLYLPYPVLIDSVEHFPKDCL